MKAHNVINLSFYRAEKAEAELRRIQGLYKMGVVGHAESMKAYHAWRKADVAAQSELFST